MLDEKQIEKLRQEALQILSPVKSFDDKTSAPKKILFTAQRSDAGRALAPYYLVFFLLNDLLNFKNLGKFEKLAWSFPVDYKGKAFLIEHRKFGLGLFIQSVEDEPDAKIIVSKINRAVKKIKPFYNHIAELAVSASELNVVNNNRDLYARFEYLKQLYYEQAAKYFKYKDDVKTEKKFDSDGKFLSSLTTFTGSKYRTQSNWLAISCIEAFYSWTEHLFIHLAVIGHSLGNGDDIANLIEAEWKVKFNAAFPNMDRDAKIFYDELLIVRQQLRNFVAHGAFGKNGNAFHFHSKAGAVPVLFNHDRSKNRFSLTGHLSFNDAEVMVLIDNFIKYLWDGPLKLAMLYTQKYDLPTILTYAQKGKYKIAMRSDKAMDRLTERLNYLLDQSTNMDW